MTSDLAAFLTGRLDEDEAVATDQHERVWFGPYPETLAEREGWIVIRQDRLLREVAAKRAILDQSEVEVEYGRQVDSDVRDALDSAVRHLAAVYSDHPAYLPEWAP